MLVFNGFAHERNSQDDEAGDNKQNDGEVEVVDTTYDGGTVTRINTAACPESKLGYHPGQPDTQADSEAIKRSLRKESCRKSVSQAVSGERHWTRSKIYLALKGIFPNASKYHVTNVLPCNWP